jgi:Protein of unknown function (DUF3110)
MRVYILLFNAGTDNEGIHTIQINNPEDVSGQLRNKILMFASEDDATRYALLLEAQDFPTAKIEELDSEEIEAFCRDADYDWEIVGDGELAIPPQSNLEETDWDVENKPEDEIDMADDELEKIRRRLEGLL